MYLDTPPDDELDPPPPPPPPPPAPTSILNLFLGGCIASFVLLVMWKKPEFRHGLLYLVVGGLALGLTVRYFMRSAERDRQRFDQPFSYQRDYERERSRELRGNILLTLFGWLLNLITWGRDDK